MTWRIADGALSLESPLLMGVVNVTPDSFSDGGRFAGEEAVAHGIALLEAGADIIDVGGESTRPGAHSVSESEELDRISDVVTGLVAAGAVVSIDTMKPVVAAHAIESGAAIVNDVAGLVDPAMRQLVADTGAGVVIMHMQGEPRTMQEDPIYDNVMGEIIEFLGLRAGLAEDAGVSPDAIVVDPGIGFGKTVRHNLEVIDRLEELAGLGYPVLIGASRKRFIGEVLGIDEPSLRDPASAIITALAIERGASIVRVHDVVGSRQAVSLVRAIVGDGGFD